MTQELKPCPFCNGASKEIGTEGSAFVYCLNDNCGATIVAPIGKATDRWNARSSCAAKERAYDADCILRRAPEGAWRKALEIICETFTAEYRKGTTTVFDAMDAVAKLLNVLHKTSPHVWQPIETAPRDGTQILIFTPYSNRYTVEGIAKVTFSHTSEDGRVWWQCCEHPYVISEATRWSHLPEPAIVEVTLL